MGKTLNFESRKILITEIIIFQFFLTNYILSFIEGDMSKKLFFPECNHVKRHSETQ